MNDLYLVVCDTEDKAKWAFGALAQNGFKNINVKRTDHIEISEVVGSLPNFSPQTVLDKQAAIIWIVTAER